MTKKKIGSRQGSQEFYDSDYWYKLSPEEKEYLAQFCREYYRNQFDKTAPLHDTKQKRLAVYSNDNARRRDLWNNAQRTELPVELLSDDED